MFTLGVETSCDETSVSVVRGREVISVSTLSSLKLFESYGGIIPEIASRRQLFFVSEVFKDALRMSGIKLSQLKLISVTRGPGLIGSLVVGLQFAKGLSLSLGIPILGVDHLLGHIFAAFLGKERISFPFIGLIVSGGHTRLLLVNDFDRVEVLGRTLDDACGEALDKVGRFYGLPYPAAPHIDKAFNIKDVDKKMFRIKKREDFNFSFSGIKTAAVYIAEDKRASSSAKILSSFQYTVVDNIIYSLHKACKKLKIKRVVCGGGVLLNNYLRERLKELSKERIKILIAEKEYCQDNAAFVAGLGAYLYRKGYKSSLNIEPYTKAGFNKDVYKEA